MDSKGLTIHQAVERLLRKALGQEITLDTFSDNDLLAEAGKRNLDFKPPLSEKENKNRKREETILEIVRRIHAETDEVASLNDVLTEAGRSDISKDVAEDIIDILCRDGRLMRPGGYETLQPV